MITKFNKYIKEGVRNLMTPKSKDEVKSAYSNLINSFHNPIKNMAIEWSPEFKKVADVLGISMNDLHAVVEGNDKQYDLLDEFFGELVENEEEIKVEISYHSDEHGNNFDGGEYSCYPNHKLAYWSSETFDDPHVWLFSKKHFDVYLNESIRNMMTPKSKEEILNSLKGDRTVVFKPTNNLKYDMSGTVGYIDASYSDLVALFGEPNGDIDGYKSSTAWDLVDNLGRYVGIQDWKQTDLYDPDYPSVEEFRNQPSYKWHIYANYYDGEKENLLEDLRTYIISHII